MLQDSAELFTTLEQGQHIQWSVGWVNNVACMNPRYINVQFGRMYWTQNTCQSPEREHKNYLWCLNTYFYGILSFNFYWGKQFPLCMYTGCPRRNGQNFGRVFLMLNYTDITQNTYIQSWTVTETMAWEKCGHLAFPRTVRLQLSRIDLDSAIQQSSLWLHALRLTQ